MLHSPSTFFLHLSPFLFSLVIQEKEPLETHKPRESEQTQNPGRTPLRTTRVSGHTSSVTRGPSPNGRPPDPSMNEKKASTLPQRARRRNWGPDPQGGPYSTFQLSAKCFTVRKNLVVGYEYATNINLLCKK